MKRTPLPTNPSGHKNLSGVQFRYFPPEPLTYPQHELTAMVPETLKKPDGGEYTSHKEIGTIKWHQRTGEINWVRTHPDYRGLGVATTLLEKAHKLSADTGIKAPKHSRHRTELGDKWAGAVGGDVPPRAHYQEK